MGHIMLKTNLIETLHHLRLFESLASDEIEALSNHSEIVTFPPATIFLKQGEVNDALYVVISGTVILSAKNLGNGETHIESLGQGNFLNEASFIVHCPSAVSIFAKDQLQCLLITRAYFDYLGLFSRSTQYKLLAILAKQISKRIVDVQKQVANMMTQLDMTTTSFLGEVSNSLNTPAIISPKEVNEQLIELRKAPLFQDFSENEIEEFFKIATILKTSKHCTLIHENGIDNNIYIVLRGAVQSNISKDNKSAKLSVIGPQLLFCSLSVIDQSLYSPVNFTTCENAIVLKIPADKLNQLQKSQVTLWYKFYYLVCQSIVALSRSMNKLDIRLNIENYNR